MSELIRREDARNAVQNCNCTHFLDIIELFSALNEIPSVDAVEVVRKPIKGYEGYYEVDQLGRVYSVNRTITVNDNGRVYDKPLSGGKMKQGMHSAGYKVVSLTKDGKTKRYYVHRLVAEAFIDNPNNLPFINHKDEDKTNNFADNLEWCTNEYNINYGNARAKQARKIKGRRLTEEHKDKIRSGVIKICDNGNTKLTRQIICLNTGDVYASINNASRELGISRGTLWSACKRQTATKQGLRFMFYDDYCSYGERRE